MESDFPVAENQQTRYVTRKVQKKSMINNKFNIIVGLF